LEAPSYASEWSVAQVLSHLGSGAEIFSLFLRSGIEGSPPPGMAEFEPIWEAWNARSAGAQATDALAADRAFLDQVVAIDEPTRAAWHLDLMGADRGLSDVMRLRLREHAVHSWDIQVTQDDKAVLAPDATALIIDSLDEMVGRVARPPDVRVHALIKTTDPSRRLLLTGEDGESMTLQAAGEAETDDGVAVLELPAEALVRLVYGRLDPAHTPVVGGDGALLDTLRRVFPGF
jgi:uncharacterized protein (TIGR03083 family)